MRRRWLLSWENDGEGEGGGGGEDSSPRQPSP